MTSTPKELLLCWRQTRGKFARLQNGTCCCCCCCYTRRIFFSYVHQSYCFLIKHKLGWAPATWPGSVSSLWDFKLSTPTLVSHPGKQSAPHWNKSLAEIVTRSAKRAGNEHLNQTGRRQWKERFRTPLIKCHYIDSINQYSLSTLSLYKEHIHRKWHIHSIAVILITFQKAIFQSKFLLT